MSTTPDASPLPPIKEKQPDREWHLVLMLGHFNPNAALKPANLDTIKEWIAALPPDQQKELGVGGYNTGVQSATFFIHQALQHGSRYVVSPDDGDSYNPKIARVADMAVGLREELAAAQSRNAELETALSTLTRERDGLKAHYDAVYEQLTAAQDHFAELELKCTDWKKNGDRWQQSYEDLQVSMCEGLGIPSDLSTEEVIGSLHEEQQALKEAQAKIAELEGRLSAQHTAVVEHDALASARRASSEHDAELLDQIHDILCGSGDDVKRVKWEEMPGEVRRLKERATRGYELADKNAELHLKAEAQLETVCWELNRIGATRGNAATRANTAADMYDALIHDNVALKDGTAELLRVPSDLSVEEIQGSVEQLRTERDQLRARITQLETEQRATNAGGDLCAIKDGVIADLRGTVTRLERELADEKRAYMNYEKRASEEVNDLRVEINRLTGQVEERTARAHELRTERDQLHNELVRLTTGLYETYENDCEDDVGNEVTPKTAVDAAFRMFDTLNKNVLSARANRDQLRAEFDTAKQENLRVEANLQNALESNERLHKENAELALGVAAAEALGVKQAEVDRIRSKCSRQRRELRRLNEVVLWTRGANLHFGKTQLADRLRDCEKEIARRQKLTIDRAAPVFELYRCVCTELSAARAEISRLRPVWEAARQWRTVQSVAVPGEHSLRLDLVRAVDAAQSTEEK